ncbi:MAG: hypothetical protein LBS01_09910 [Prevotellaceae bacterium]|jgi:uncharacterized protein|nr:hypothetical protein [Prevotellaceae bacterium]
MKKAYYIHPIQLNEDTFLYYNAYSNVYLFLSAEKHNIFQATDANQLKLTDNELYHKLLEGEFLLEDDIDETKITEFFRNVKKMDTSQYHIVINTTLDCNLNCWYCYESKVEGSILTEKTIELIKKILNKGIWKSHTKS